MRNKFSVPALVALLVLSTLTMCTKDTNLVDDLEPMAQENIDYIHHVHNRLKSAESPAEMQKIIDENPWVIPRVITFARQLGHVPAGAVIDSVVFAYGSADARAQDKTKEWFNGKITDELVAFIFFNGRKEPVGTIVRCINGIIVGLDHLQRIGKQNLVFTIGPRQGLNTYVDYPTAINLAEHFNLPLYKGQRMRGDKKITPDEARKLEDEVDKTQVTVLVHEGDVFNVGNMTYTPRH